MRIYTVSRFTSVLKIVNKLRRLFFTIPKTLSDDITETVRTGGGSIALSETDTLQLI